MDFYRHYLLRLLNYQNARFTFCIITDENIILFYCLFRDIIIKFNNYIIP